MKNKIDLLKAVNYMLFFMLLIAAVLRFGIFKADAAAAWKGFASTGTNPP